MIKSMKNIIDISLPLSVSLPTWPKSPGFELLPVAMFEEDGYNETMIRMGSHFGTHIDAPRHFLPNGLTVDQINLEDLIGQVYVAEVLNVKSISADTLELLSLPVGINRLLFKTLNSSLWSSTNEFCKDFVALTLDGVQWLVDFGIKLVGIDYLSIQRFHDSNRTHEKLLGAGIIVLEGLNLAKVQQGYYELTCLPLPVVGAEGAPARVILSR